MEDGHERGRSEPKRSFRELLQLILPEARMRVVSGRLPRDWFELLTRIPVVERIVIKRFVENLMCDQWLQTPHTDLEGLHPSAAMKEAHGRILLEGLLERMAHNREKTPRELRRIRRRLGL